MEITIGPYKISQRTEYSKIQIYDIKQNKNITNENTDLMEKILEDYSKQLDDPGKYFDIEDDALVRVKEAVKYDDIKYLFVPDRITMIKEDAFRYQNVEMVKLPCSIRTIEQFAFYGSFSLKTINIENSVEEIKEYCFHRCEKLESIKLPNIKVLANGIFANCQNLNEVILPDGLNLISSIAFDECVSLKKITIPNTVITVGEYAFRDCKNLEYIKLSENLEKIESGAFSCCGSLKEIILPDSVCELCNAVFYRAFSLKSINIPKNLNCIGWRPFLNSGINTLIFNHNLEKLQGVNRYNVPCDLIEGSNIDKLIISDNATIITPRAVGVSGGQIKKIDYLGTKEQFDKFKENNQQLFNLLPNLENITFNKTQNYILDDFLR